MRPRPRRPLQVHLQYGRSLLHRDLFEAHPDVRGIHHIVAARGGLPSEFAAQRALVARLRGERFDVVVVDPPAFVKRRSELAGGLRGYRDINLRALRLLKPGGTLVTCSCSYNVDEATFGQIVFEAAMDARVHVQVVEKRMQGRDHPVLLGVPETYYLKCFILRRLH